jgi:hypothetical protein
MGCFEREFMGFSSDSSSSFYSFFLSPPKNSKRHLIIILLSSDSSEDDCVGDVAIPPFTWFNEGEYSIKIVME